MICTEIYLYTHNCGKLIKSVDNYSLFQQQTKKTRDGASLLKCDCGLINLFYNILLFVLNILLFHFRKQSEF